MAQTMILSEDSTLVRRVRVDRARTPQQVIDATGRIQNVDSDILATMPHGDVKVQEVDVVFFKVGRRLTDSDLKKEYEIRGLVPDPYAQAAVNEADPAFADTYCNATYWEDANEGYCVLTFHVWCGDRELDVGFTEDFCEEDGGPSYWADDWWYGGCRK